MPEGKRRRMWNWTLSIGSFLVPFFFGILFISLVQGMPLDANGNSMRNLRIILICFQLLVSFQLLTRHELYCFKTEGPIRERARNYAEILYGVLYVGLVVLQC